MSTTLQPAVERPPLPASPTAQSAKRGQRILYAAGAGNILGTFAHWKDRTDDPSQLSLTYSGQFFDACQRLDCKGLVLVHDAATGRRQDDRFDLRQIPPPRFRNGPGPLYHLAQIWYGLRIVALAVREKADVVVPASGACHWFVLGLLPRFGIKVVPALHCVLWPKYRKPGRLGRLINRLDARFFARRTAAILTASSDIDQQLAELAGPERFQRMRILPFLPTYRRASFPELTPPPPAAPFRVLYAGRIEPEKGVFDLLQAAALFADKTVEFDVCGQGSALDEMKNRAAAAGLSNRIRFHGHCERPKMVEMFRNCHAVIVPTTTHFVEGFNQVVAEGILAGRPVIASAVCPAVQYVGQAVIAVPPDDVHAYAKAIDRLALDKNFYASASAACENLREQFFDESRGWAAAIESAIGSINSKERPTA